MPDQYARFAASLRWLAEHYREQPDLAEIAARSDLSPAHFQRAFSQWVGVSPKKFVEHLSVHHARDMLAHGGNVLDAALEVGLSGPSRLHDLFIRHEALSPGEYKSGGAGLAIRYGFHPSPFGEVLIGESARGITGLVFVEPGQHAVRLADMRKRLPRADFSLDDGALAATVQRVFAPANGGELRLLLAGSPFQISVWRALLALPVDGRCSYGQIATAIERPKAYRAVGTAVGANPVALLIPCHRVIRADAGLGGYRWGLERKLAIQGWEQGVSAGDGA